MRITNKSDLSGNENTLEIDVTPEQIQAWQNGTLIQNAMPNLTADEREFLISGITAEEWAEVFGDDDDE